MKKTIYLALAATMLSALTFTRTYNKQEIIKSTVDAQTWPYLIELGVTVIGGVATWAICEYASNNSGGGDTTKKTWMYSTADLDRDGNYETPIKTCVSGDANVNCQLGDVYAVGSGVKIG